MLSAQGLRRMVRAPWRTMTVEEFHRLAPTGLLLVEVNPDGSCDVWMAAQLLAAFDGPDHRQRAIDFHRRAQAAEGAEIRVRHEAMFWHDAWRRVASSRRTLKRKLSRTRAQLRAARWTEPLTRIIELGKIFP